MKTKPMLWRATLALACSLLVTTSAAAQSVRIATYNIQNLTSTDRAERLDSVRNAINALDADIIALQEIHDRETLEAVFDKNRWHLIIDDESGSRQDLAVAVRRTLSIRTQQSAGDDDFLFPFEDNTWFPNRRDVLHVEVDVPGQTDPLNVLVVHLKSRLGGRAATDFRRAGAAMRLVDTIDTRFRDLPVVLLGDFNDNPDDRALNILETGDPGAVTQKEDRPGSFMRNLTEPLLAQGFVTNSLNSMKIDSATGRVIARDANSRDRNYDKRDTNTHTGNILFDQILTTPALTRYYVADSATVFEGKENVGASDHLPVYADFDFGNAGGGDNNGDNGNGDNGDDNSAQGGLYIVELLPNPTGNDAGRERVTIENLTNDTISLDGVSVEDRSGNQFLLQGQLASGARSDIILRSGSVTLNNSGDEISLVSSTGRTLHRVSYSGSEVTSGVPIVFQTGTESGEDDADDSNDGGNGDDTTNDDGESVRISALLPNPTGNDAGAETFTLTNTGVTAANITDWIIEERGGKQLRLATTIAAGQSVTFTIPASSGASAMPLNNSGDAVSIFNASGIQIDSVSYSRSDVSEGEQVRF